MGNYIWCCEVEFPLGTRLRQVISTYLKTIFELGHWITKKIWYSWLAPPRFARQVWIRSTFSILCHLITRIHGVEGDSKDICGPSKNRKVDFLLWISGLFTGTALAWVLKFLPWTQQCQTIFKLQCLFLLGLWCRVGRTQSIKYYHAYSIGVMWKRRSSLIYRYPISERSRSSKHFSWINSPEQFTRGRTWRKGPKASL